jgi:hypothetical protein
LSQHPAQGAGARQIGESRMAKSSQKEKGWQAVASRYYAFIVRIRFVDPNAHLSAEPTVRGSVQQAGSEQNHPFDSFEQLVALLKVSIGWEDPGRLGADEGVGTQPQDER